MQASKTYISIVAVKHLEETLKIVMAVHWICIYYTIIEYEGITVTVD